MNKICMLDKQYNQCPFISEDQTCHKGSQCNMQVKLKESAVAQSYKREPRWYEKYYKSEKEARRSYK